MQSKAARVAVVLSVIAAAVVLFVVLNGGGDDDEAAAPETTQTTRKDEGSSPPTKPRPPRVETVTVRGGRAVGGVKELEYRNGERVRLVVRSDVSDEVHVHGYDLTRDVAAGGSARFNFRATLEGVFEVELETRHEQIASLVVRPK
jgi:hypothetical protein